MDDQNFDRLTRAISTRLPRRTLAGLLGLGAAGLSTLGLMNPTDARKKKKKKKKKKTKQKVELNDFECVDVGSFCKNASQCCSGICSGKKNSKTCQAHDQSTCQAGQDSCISTVLCTTTAGFPGGCGVTTGKAPYCYSGEAIACFPCSKDSDCVPTYGAGAACLACAPCSAENPQGTACVGTAEAL